MEGIIDNKHMSMNNANSNAITVTHAHTKEGAGINDYLLSILAPRHHVTSIPDANLEPVIVKSIRGDHNLVGSTNYVLVFMPFATGPTLLYGARTTHPVSGAPVIGFSGYLNLDEDLTHNYNKARLVSYELDVFSDTIPAGAFAINGRISASHFSSCPDYSSLDPAAMSQFNTYQSVVNVGVLDGVVSLAFPRTEPAMKKLNPTGSTSRLGSMRSHYDTVVFEGNLGATGFPLSATCLSITSSNSNQFPLGMRGHMSVNLSITYERSVAAVMGKITLFFDYIDAAGAFQIAAQHDFHHHRNATDRFNLNGSAELFSIYPVTRVRLNVDNGGTALSGNVVLQVSYSSDMPSEDSNVSVIYAYGLDTNTQLSVNQAANYEAVPNVNLSRDVMPVKAVPDTFIDFTMALTATSMDSRLRPIYQRSEYEHFCKTELMSIVSRGLLLNQYAMDWNSIKKLGANIFSGLKKTKNFWLPAVSTINPILGRMADAAFAQTYAMDSKFIYNNKTYRQTAEALELSDSEDPLSVPKPLRKIYNGKNPVTIKFDVPRSDSSSSNQYPKVITFPSKQELEEVNETLKDTSPRKRILPVTYAMDINWNSLSNDEIQAILLAAQSTAAARGIKPVATKSVSHISWSSVTPVITKHRGYANLHAAMASWMAGKKPANQFQFVASTDANGDKATYWPLFMSESPYEPFQLSDGTPVIYEESKVDPYRKYYISSNLGADTREQLRRIIVQEGDTGVQAPPVYITAYTDSVVLGGSTGLALYALLYNFPMGLLLSGSFDANGVLEPIAGSSKGSLKGLIHSGIVNNTIRTYTANDLIKDTGLQLQNANGSFIISTPHEIYSVICGSVRNYSRNKVTNSTEDTPTIRIKPSTNVSLVEEVRNKLEELDSLNPEAFITSFNQSDKALWNRIKNYRAVINQNPATVETSWLNRIDQLIKRIIALTGSSESRRSRKKTRGPTTVVDFSGDSLSPEGFIE